MNQPLQLYKPVSSTTAAYIGTRIGGLAVGIAAASEAERKREDYEKNVIDVINSQMARKSTHDRLKYCFDEIIKIIMTNEKTKKDWQNIENTIDSELHEKYAVR